MLLWRAYLIYYQCRIFFYLYRPSGFVLSFDSVNPMGVCAIVDFVLVIYTFNNVINIISVFFIRIHLILFIFWRLL